jgi:hypothetical protein
MYVLSTAHFLSHLPASHFCLPTRLLFHFANAFSFSTCHLASLCFFLSLVVLFALINVKCIVIPSFVIKVAESRSENWKKCKSWTAKTRFSNERNLYHILSFCKRRHRSNKLCHKNVFTLFIYICWKIFLICQYLQLNTHAHAVYFVTTATLKK